MITFSEELTLHLNRRDSGNIWRSYISRDKTHERTSDYWNNSIVERAKCYPPQLRKWRQISMTGHQGFCSNSVGLKRHFGAPQSMARPIGSIKAWTQRLQWIPMHWLSMRTWLADTVTILMQSSANIALASYHQKESQGFCPMIFKITTIEGVLVANSWEEQ